MNRSSARIAPVAALAVLSALAAPAAHAAEPAVETLRSDLEALVPPLLDEYRVPGIAVAVLIDREIVLVRGFGREAAAADSPAVDAQTVFEAASLSKPVFAFALHRRIADPDAPLDLDRPLAELRTPDAPYVDDARLRRVTARHVLAHASGLPNWRPGRWRGEPEPLRVGFRPGKKFRYSGEGYVWLQRVVESVDGMPLERWMANALLDELGMDSSSFVWESRFEASFARPHDADGRTVEKRRPTAALAAATLHTTADDLARYLRAVLRADAEPWLRREIRIDGRLGWSLGWGVEVEAGEDGGDLFWQWGDNGPFKALAAGSHSRGIAVVVLTNGERGLNVARPIVERVLGGKPAFLDFRMLNY